MFSAIMHELQNRAILQAEAEGYLAVVIMTDKPTSALAK